MEAKNAKFKMNKPIYDCFVTEEDCELMHEMTLRVFEETGVAVEHDEALEIFKKAGAKVDGNIVKMDRKLIEDCIKLCPSNFEIVGRGMTTGVGPDYDPAVTIAFGPPYILDHRTNQMRTGNLDDTVDFLKLTEGSDVINLQSIVVQDAPGLDQHLDNTFTPQQALMLKYCTKPLVPATARPLAIKHQQVRDAVVEGVELIQDFYGVDRSTIVNMPVICPLAPLVLNYECIENIFGLAQSNQAVQISILGMTNLSTPPTIMGTVVHDNVVTLAGIILCQLIKPGMPVVRCSLTGPVDLRTITLCVGSPEHFLVCMASMALGRYYGIPTRVGGSQTDAYEPDFQAGVESFMGLSATYMCNADFLLHVAGILGSFNICSLEKFLLDEETIRYNKRIVDGIRFSEKKAYVKQLNKVGPRGNFVESRTPKDYREETMFFDLFHKAGSSIATRDEKGTLREKTSKAVDKRLEEYEIPDATKEQKKLLNKWLPEGYKYDI
ncbi:Glycine betaine methyltransferase [Eubacterium callanderi]|uniref:trimethylamine methyltransferase family protein n=1 Tax=Eubacterium callanderi TaxID=53442 RepID=UPI0029FEDD23|nr:trimethylamine methyltransferase family protein [Eubacterium callanderi]WPK69204.1 Glycine betaine methyltransferase [Eubacterium callanderi]WPK73502.1 Glycine betaine methyltransferase [Eubacterium callanderi]